METAPALTPEEIQVVEEMKKAVASFGIDPRHDRYQPCEDNRMAIETYLTEHSLNLTAESLHLAFVDLAKEGKLALFEESRIPEAAATTETPKEKKLPPIGLATASDLGVGWAEQQRARKQVEPGPRPSNRNAFIEAGQNTSSPRIKIQRFHL